MRSQAFLSCLLLALLAIPPFVHAQNGLKSGNDSSRSVQVDPSGLAQALAEAGEDIDVMNARWVHAFRTQDAEKAAALFDRDGALLGENGSITFGSKQIQQAMSRWMKQLGPAQVTFTRSDLWRLDPFAYETGHFSYSWTDRTSGSEMSSTGPYMTVWKRQEDGSWRIWRSIPLPEDNLTPNP